MAVIEAIETVYLEADAAIINISSIPSTYEHLELRVSLTCDSAAAVAYYMELNGDTTSGNYRNAFLRAVQGTILGMALDSSMGWAPTLGGNNLPASVYMGAVVQILDYSTTNKKTSAICERGCTTDLASYGFVSLIEGGVWNDTAVVDEIELSTSAGSFVRGSTVTLYGLNSS